MILTDYEQAKSEISRIVYHYNDERRHSSLQYLTPMQYYRGNPEVLLAVREAKIEKAKQFRKERNMEIRKGGELAGTISLRNSYGLTLRNRMASSRGETRPSVNPWYR